MNSMSDKIESFHVKSLWGKRNIHWDGINPQMNILVGINGSGKTTLLNLMYDYYSSKTIDKKYGENIHVETSPDKLYDGLPMRYLMSLDNYSQKDKRKKGTALLQELEHIVYQNKENFSFFNYRIQMLDYPDKAAEINRRIETFFSSVNSLFTETGKKIALRDSRLVFTQGDATIELNQLSSGEQQLLLIMLNVFLLGEKPAIVFMDEPEISLHVTWQYKLLNILTKLNGNAQFIVTTHSPSIFGDGWGANVVYMEDITEEV